MPAGVPAATFTAPVAGSRVTPGFVVLTWVSVTLASVAGAPFKVSLASTFGTAVPPVAPDATVPVSLRASMTAAPTVTVTVAVSQFVGFSCSQIRYVTVYVPAGVAGATFTAPVAGSRVTFGWVVLTWLIVTLASVAGAPFKVSLASTLGTAVPPDAPDATEPVSLTASIGEAETTTVAAALSQLFGLRTSQIV